MNVRAVCEKGNTIHIVSLVNSSKVPPGPTEKAKSVHWIEEISHEGKKYNYIYKMKRDHLPSFELEGGAKVFVDYLLGGYQEV